MRWCRSTESRAPISPSQGPVRSSTRLSTVCSCSSKGNARQTDDGEVRENLSRHWMSLVFTTAMQNYDCAAVLAFRWHDVLWPVPFCTAQWTAECLCVHVHSCLWLVNVSSRIGQCVTELCVLIRMQLLGYYSVCLSVWQVCRYYCLPHVNCEGELKLILKLL